MEAKLFRGSRNVVIKTQELDPGNGRTNGQRRCQHGLAGPDFANVPALGVIPTAFIHDFAKPASWS